MKKTLVALAAVASTAAFAQSSVTIDGVFDLGVRKLSSGVAAADSGAHLASSTANQIRFTVREDLGGGMTATAIAAMRFILSDGFTEGALTAQTRALFQGETSVGIGGGFGSVKLGRFVTPAQGPLGAIGSVWATDTVASVALGGQYFSDESYNAFYGTTGGQGRSDLIAYTTPTISGLNATIGYGFKQRMLDLAASTTINKDDQDSKDLLSLAVNYADGPITATVLYEANRGTQAADSRDSVTGIGGSYTISGIRLVAGYALTNFGGDPDDESAWAIGADIPFGASTFKLGYRNIRDAGGADGVKRTKFGLGIYHALSKRTTVYSNYGSEDRSNENSRRNGFDLGIRHTF